MLVDIHLPALNEEKYVSRALTSLHEGMDLALKMIPGLQINTVLLLDARTKDRTQQVSKDLGISQIIITGPGKLTARHIGTVLSKADLIISCDCDTFYPLLWVYKTIRPFLSNTELVGVTGPRIYEDGSRSLIERLAVEASAKFSPYVKRMFGSNCAYLRSAYARCGGFKLNIDQTDSRRMIEEEEMMFWNRLSDIGQVYFDRSNYVVTSNRRISRSDQAFNDAVKNRERF